MLPLRDENPTRGVPLLTLAIILGCVAVFVYQKSLPPRQEQELALRRGLVPDVVTSLPSLPPQAIGAGALSPITSMFLHGDILHLVGNMWFLWIFGNNVEARLGHVRFAVFYLISGLAAAAAQVAALPASDVPMIGASGAIAGVLGAYLVLFPGARILTLVPFFFIYIVRLPAFLVLGIWFLFQILHSTMASGRPQAGIAWFAHVGGFVAGMLLVLIMAPRRQPPASPARDAGWV